MSKVRVKLVALDLDGTTLNNHHDLSDRTISVLRRLSAGGVIVSIATGRSVVNVLRYIEELDLSQAVIPTVCYNGAVGLKFEKECSSNVRTKSTIFEDQIPQSSAELLIKFAANNNLVLQYYNAETGEVYASPQTDAHHILLQRYAALVGRSQAIVESYQSVIEESAAAKILLLHDDAEHVMKLAREQLPMELFNMFRGSPDPYFVEFLRPDASKGNGVRQVCEYLGVDLSQVVAFGDGENDKELLEYAGIGVAMKNAKQLAKESANIVLEWTNDEDGVARHLEMMEAEGYFYDL